MATGQVWELRQYTLHPGRRDDLVEVFDRWFLEGQEDHGMLVQGQFYDLDRPDRFVWLRSFPDLERRQAALAGFYGGPVWAAHRDVANATMVSSDDVLLLRPVSPDGAGIGFSRPGSPARADAVRPPIGSTARPQSLISIDVYYFIAPVDEKDLNFFVTEVEPFLLAAGSGPSSLLVTEPGPNTFPALPVRENAQALVRIARFDDEPAHEAYRARMVRSELWAAAMVEMSTRLGGTSQRMRLQPTARSRLR